MKSGITCGKETIKQLYQLINDDNREKTISALTLEDTNNYIDAIKAEKNDLNRIVNTVFKALSPGFYPLKYEKYQIKTKNANDMHEISILPTPPFEQLKECLLELNRHKRNIITQKWLHKELKKNEFQNEFFSFIKSVANKKKDELFISENKEEIKDSEGLNIKEAEQKVAEQKIAEPQKELEQKVAEQNAALESRSCYEDLSNQYRCLVEENERIKSDLQNEKIKHENDIKQILQQNEKLQQMCDELSKEKNNLILEQKKDLDAKLTCIAKTPQVSNISKETLSKILQGFDKQNAIFVFFPKANQTLSKLNALSNKEIISVDDVKKCIDPAYENLFNDPLTHYPDGTSKTASIVHALGLEIRKSQGSSFKIV